GEVVAVGEGGVGGEAEDRPRDGGEVAKAVVTHLAAAEERARLAELDRVRLEERRKRLRVQLVLAGAVLLLLALSAFGATLASLWHAARQAKVNAESARDQLADEKKQT